LAGAGLVGFAWPQAALAAGPPPASVSAPQAPKEAPKEAPQEAPALAIKNWSARKPVLLADGKLDWTAAPEFLHWRAAKSGEPVRGRVLGVHLTGPFADGAWSQHAGALMNLNHMVPVGQIIEFQFKARSVAGPKFLSVLRSWGGAKPWNAYPITTEWESYTVKLTPQFPTDIITFSLVPRAGGLQPYCAGHFELAEVQVLLAVEPNPAPSPQTGWSCDTFWTAGAATRCECHF